MITQAPQTVLGGTVNYRITGTLEEVLKDIEKVFNDYHPYGYSTRVERISHAAGENYIAAMSRAGSCD